MGNNGKPNDNMLMHILSPYAAHRSALTDTEKLVNSGFSSTCIVLIYGLTTPAGRLIRRSTLLSASQAIWLLSKSFKAF